jgi:tetratricopeptide (TPR) repeat protein
MRCVFVFLLLAAAARAQVPDKFTNLQVLPKDISSKDLMWTMRGFCFSLGVRCEYCHAGKNFNSDDLKTKITARNMLRMVAAINRDYIPKENNIKVDCVTCHHGLSRPRSIQDVVLEEMDKSDVSSAIALYRKLRKETYGSARYDFSETSLNLLSETLVHGGKPKEAAAFMELNLELNSQLSNWAYSDLAMAHIANHEPQKAEADFSKILEGDPENSWAKEELEKLRQYSQ